MLSAQRTIDGNDIIVGIGLIIHKLKKIRKESDARISSGKIDQEEIEKTYKAIADVLKNMAETGLCTEAEMRGYTDEIMKGDKYPGIRPAEFYYVLDDIWKKAA